MSRHLELQRKYEELKAQNKRKEKKPFVKDTGHAKLVRKEGTAPQILRKNKKIDVVIVSVNYNDYLAISLRENVKIFNNITIVTSTQDILCQKICEKFSVNCVVTDVMYEDEATFNKGKAINEGIRSIKNPDFILLIDADIIVKNPINLDSLKDDTLYTSSRYIVKSYSLLEDYLNSKSSVEDVATHESDKGIGFFQMFNINHNSIDKNQVYPEFSNDASWDDLLFRDKFPKRETVQNTILHLGDSSINWKGRKTSRFLSDKQLHEIISKKSTFTICSYLFNHNNNSKQISNFKRFIQQFSNHFDKLIVGMTEEIEKQIDFDINCKKLIVEGLEGLWSKETIINQIIDTVDTDYIIWIDGDIIYENLEWLEDIDKMMSGNDFLQLFNKIVYLDERNNQTDTFQSIYSQNSNNIDELLGKGFKPGGAWCGRTSILKDKKLFDKMYVGGGDTIFTYGLNSVKDGFTLNKIKKYHRPTWAEAIDWIESLDSYKVGFLDTTVYHLYHGELSKRNYNERYVKLKELHNKTTMSQNLIVQNQNLENKSEKIKSKVVVYTCISGNYDSLKEVKNKVEGVDYICFTNIELTSESWQIRKIPEYLSSLEQTKKARCIKILPHLFLEYYETSIWIDGNIEVVGDVIKLVEKYPEEYFSIPKHPDRICIYQEAEAIIKMKKDTEENVSKQIKKYRDSGYPENFGLVQSNVIIRKHNHKNCKDICENWWRELVTQSKRDQLSFNYSIWNKDFNINIINPSIIDSEFFNIWTHIQKGGQKTKVRRGYDSIKNYINGKEV